MFFSFQTLTNVGAFPDAARMAHASTRVGHTAVPATKGSWQQWIKMFVKVNITFDIFFFLSKLVFDNPRGFDA